MKSRAPIFPFYVVALVALAIVIIIIFPPAVTGGKIITPNIIRYIDEEAEVVCWITTEYSGIYCLPISQTKLEIRHE